MGKEIVSQLDPIFRARSVAIIGASNNPTKWGYSLVERPLRSGFGGPLYPINPREREVLGVPAYPSIAQVPGPVDLAVFTMPAAAVPAALEECLAHQVRGAVVISAGFAEAGPQGRALQEELVRVARRGGIRFVGPNCNGIWSSAAGLSLFSSSAPKPGPFAFVSQSGAFGGQLAQMAMAKGYGLSKFISSGNQADLNDADYLEYLAEDPDTKVIVLYVEGLREPRRFLETAREVVRHKPIVVYKAGRTPVGGRAVLGHTGSLMMAEAVFEALCQQVGLIRAYESSHPFDMAEALASCPLPKGRRVGIIAMTGGQCVITSDFCAYLGLEVPELDAQTQGRLREILAPHAPPPRNPVDIAGDFRTPLTFARLAEELARLNYIDTIIISPPSGGLARDPAASGAALSPLREAAERIAAIPSQYGKPVIVAGNLRQGQEALVEPFRQAGIPSYATPEECARAVYALVRYAEVRG